MERKDIEKLVIEAVVAEFSLDTEIDSIKMEERIEDLGVEDFEFELVWMDIEDRLGIEILDEEAEAFELWSDVVDLIQAKLGLEY